MKKLVDGILVDLTVEEISEKEAQDLAWLEIKSTAEEEATARENLKASAKAKLIAGEPLTEEEANTIVL